MEMSQCTVPFAVWFSVQTLIDMHVLTYHKHYVYGTIFLSVVYMICYQTSYICYMILSLSLSLSLSVSLSLLPLRAHTHTS